MSLINVYSSISEVADLRSQLTVFLKETLGFEFMCRCL